VYLWQCTPSALVTPLLTENTAFPARFSHRPNSLLPKRCAKLGRKLIQHGLDSCIGEMTEVAVDRTVPSSRGQAQVISAGKHAGWGGVAGLDKALNPDASGAHSPGNVEHSFRRLDLTPNQGLPLPVRLGSDGRNYIGLVGGGLPRLLPRRGEAIRQATEIVAIVQVFRTGLSCSPRVTLLGLELHGLRGCDQSEIVFGVLKIILRSDGIAARVGLARQLKVFFRHMHRGAANSDARAVRVI
jgi:hypothetical protein